MSLPFEHFSPINASLKIRTSAPPTPKLTITETLSVTGRQFSLWSIVSLPPNPKINPNLDPKPNPKQWAILLGTRLSGYHFYTPWLFGFAVWEKSLVFLPGFSFIRTIQNSLKMLIKKGA